MIGKNPKWYIALGLTVILGAIGSGVWEIALRPSFFWCIKIIMKVITLGSESAINDFYKGAAIGQRSELGVVFFFIACWSIVAMHWLLDKFHFEIIENTALEKLGAEIEGANNNNTATELRDKLKKAMEKRRKDKVFFRYFILFMVLFITVFSFIWGILTFSKETTNSQFEQYIAICRPYLKEKQESLLRSKFSQMEGRKDYEALMLELIDIAEKNKATCPRIFIF